ncbi:hypothetical protein Apa02nite_044110 [Actinoplanes palleronii]|uniref:Uncharacterized protein n=1 Tax=Actinoplanes palleronii TaxID=113570 RepID=A0ABQ4BCA7_9ACTN|nr:hypothetical protein Apa02nite_044110 [Actinoplanes palleronii]
MLPAFVGVGDAVTVGEAVVGLGAADEVVGATVGALVVGAVVAALVGELVADGVPVRPVQAWPLTVQEVGRPVPLTMKPKLVEAPPAIEAFQPAGVNVNFWPAAARVAFQDWPTVDPAGSVSSTFQVEIFADAGLLTETSPWYPEFHEFVTVNEAASALAGSAKNATVDTVATARAEARTSLSVRFNAVSPSGGGEFGSAPMGVTTVTRP